MKNSRRLELARGDSSTDSHGCGVSPRISLRRKWLRSARRYNRKDFYVQSLHWRRTLPTAVRRGCFAAIAVQRATRRSACHAAHLPPATRRRPVSRPVRPANSCRRSPAADRGRAARDIVAFTTRTAADAGRESHYPCGMPPDPKASTAIARDKRRVPERVRMR